MKQTLKKSIWLTGIVFVSCILMAIIEVAIEPAYWVKSALKVVLFFVLPLIFMKWRREPVFSDSFSLNLKNVLKLLGLGAVIYGIVMAAFFLTRGWFDYSALVASLSADQNVSAGGFLPVALYISFGNSLLEEFLFRFVAFIKLSEHVSKKTAYLFSACMFAIYHVAMIGASFPLPLLALALVGLAVGGLIFNYVDDKSKNMYPSWIIHMFADFAIMTIWYIHI